MDFRPDVPLGVLPDIWPPFVELQTVCYAVLGILSGYSLLLFLLSAYIFSKRQQHTLRAFIFFSISGISLGGILLFSVAGMRNRWFRLQQMICALEHGPEACVKQQWEPNTWARSISLVQVILPLLSDGVIVYRTSLIWQRGWLTGTLLSLWIISLVLGSLTIAFSFRVVLVHVSKGTNDIQVPLSSYMSYGFVCSSTLCNVLASGFTAAKLWGHRRYMKHKLGISKPMTTHCHKILILLVDSGFAYCIIQIAYAALVTVYSTTNLESAQYISVAQLFFTAISGLYPGLVQFILNVLTAYADNAVVSFVITNTTL